MPASQETLHVGILIDESGSMGGLEHSVIGGINEFVGGLSAEESETPAKVTLAMFDRAGANSDVVRFRFEAIPLAEVAELVPGDYSPRGATPLNDAVLKTVRILDHASGDDDRVMMVVFTDGLENASETPAGEIRRLIEEKEQAGWEFIYLGANQDAWDESTQIGMAAQGKALAWDASPKGTADAIDFARQRVSSFRASPAEYNREAEELGDSVPEKPDPDED
jgi:hypothetical protein